MPSELWQRLRALRKHSGLSGEAFGAEVGVSKAAVSQWEATTLEKRTRPDLQTVIDLSRRFEVPLDWLLDDRSDVDFEWWVDVEDPRDGRAPSTAEALPAVLSALSNLTPGRWAMVRARLDSLPGHPEMVDEALGDVAPILQAPPAKQHVAAG